jgi:ribosome modulation factor
MALGQTPPQLNTAKKFLDLVLQKLPEAEREAARSLYSQAQDEASAISQQLASKIAEVNERAQQQNDWWERHKHLGGGNGDGNNRPDPNQPNTQPQPFNPTQLLTEIDKRIGTVADTLAGQGLALSTMLPTLVAQHGVEFGEVLDAEKLAKDAIAANTDIKAFYAQSVAERRATKAKEKYDADMKAAEARGHQAGLMEAGKSMSPYPSTRQSATTLSGLRIPEAEKVARADQYSLDAAVATAMDVMQKQAGSPA